jgi:hypothetical protein
MNERIKELARKAKEVSHWLDGGYTPVYRTNLEKFAILLMREIAMVQIKHQASMDLENKKMDDPAKELNYAVIEHFGVGK